MQSETSIFSGPDHNGPGDWFIAGYDSPCEFGDQIEEGDTIRADGFGGYEHKECVERDEELPEPMFCPECHLVHAHNQTECE